MESRADGKFYIHQVNTRVYDWFLRARTKNLPITGALLLEKAKKLARKLGNNDFNASNGWLFKFQQYPDISSRILSGEAAVIIDEDLCNWFQYLPTLCKDYKRKDIFNVDETGILTERLPHEVESIKAIRLMNIKKQKKE